MRYHIIHKTEYIYDEPASLCYNEARLWPRSFIHPLFEQRRHSSQIQIEPAYTDYRERLDFFGNHVVYFTIRQPHRQMVITVTSQIEIRPARDAPDPVVPWEQVRERLQSNVTPELLAAHQFVMASPKVQMGPALAEYAARPFEPGRPILEAIRALMAQIYSDLEFVPGVTTTTTPVAEVLEQRRGVCQDYAHLMVACLRTQGLAARYVSGYIETLPPPGEEKLVGADASHAWCAVYVPDFGWIDFDPTNNLIPTDQHITLGWGRDFSDVTPLKGVFFSNGKHKLKVAVDVERLD